MKLSDQFVEIAIAATHFRLLCRHFGTTPALMAEILAGTGIDEANLEAAQSVTIAQQARQIANMNRLFGSAFFLDIPELLHFSGHGAITVAAQSAPTLGDAMAILCNFIEVRMPVLHASLRRDGDTAMLVLETSGSAPIDPELVQPIAFIILVSLKSLVASILAHPIAAARFSARGPRLSYAGRLEAALAAPVEFDAPDTAMHFPEHWLATPSVFADAGLYNSALANLSALAVSRARPPRTLRHRIELMLAENPSGRMDAVSCAKALGLSRRTMTRRLTDEGTGFRQLLDHDLRRRALEMMAAGGFTSARVADLLGYQNPASFRRALQRWQRVGG